MLDLINKVKKNKYGYLKAGDVDKDQMTSFAVTNKQYSVDYDEIKLIYAAVAQDLKEETFKKLGLSESDDIDVVAESINKEYENLLNATKAIQNLPKLIEVAKEVKNFEKNPDFENLELRKKGMTGKLRDDIANDTNISKLLRGYNRFMGNMNAAMRNTDFKDMRALIDSTYRVTQNKETKQYNWEKEVGNLSGVIGEALIFSTVSRVNDRTKDIIESRPGGVQGQKILGLEKALDTDAQGKGDLRLLIQVINGKDVLLDFSVKTTMQKKPSEFKAAKELSLDAIPVSNDFKVDIKELAAASVYADTGKKSKKGDSLLFRKFIASLLASYAFGGYFNRALNIIYFTATGGGNPPTGKVTFRFFFQYFDKVAKGKQGSFPNLTFNKFLLEENKEDLSSLLVAARKLNTISMNISGKFL